ncbi:MAG: serine/threonine protein kinase [Myxococcales bacterium]|nr:serine/threonine protein kinase [Myxococcales bacterium]
MHTMTPGLCPTCEDPGPIAAPCARPACQRRGYHCIPHAYLPDRHAHDAFVGQKWGDYLLVRKLGAGGVGAVYLALQCPLLMETALKLFPTTASSPALAGRFEAEASALARLRHPNIVRLLQFGHHDGQPFLVMEYVPGGTTLHDAMQRGIDHDTAIDIVCQTAAGLAAAHHEEIVHRDIKPANIMLQSLPGQSGWFVRLVDFGLAKFTDAGASTQIMAGTPTYMAPEQITKRGIGPWTDWYALGAITFELLTGQRAFPRGSVERTMLLKLDPTYDPIDQIPDRALPAPLVAFFRRVLAFDAAARPATGAEFVAALRAAIAAQPTGGAGAPEPSADPALDPTLTSTEMHGEASAPIARPPDALPRPRRWLLPAAGIVLGVTLGAVWLALDAPPAPPAPDAALVLPPIAIEALDAGPADVGPHPTPALEALDATPDATPRDAMPPDARPAPDARRPPPRPSRPPRRPAKEAPVEPTMKPIGLD